MKTSLKGIWTLNSPRYQDLKVKLPGSVLSNLWSLKLIDNPYYRDYEHQIRPILEDDYTFTRRFKLSSSQLKKHNFLYLESVDTIARIYINGVLIASLYNMHLPNRIQLDNAILKRDNEITIKFTSAYTFIRDYPNPKNIFMTTGVTMEKSPVIRKANYMFGWDWAPNLADIGVYGEMYIESTNLGVCNSLRYETSFNEDRSVKLDIIFDFLKLGEGEINFKLLFDDELINEENLTLSEINQTSFLIKKPKLWYPTGYGEPHLYDLEITIKNKEEMQFFNRKIGLKKIFIDTSYDDVGRKYEFYINDEKIFLKGGNLIPEDTIIPLVNPNRTRELLQTCKDHNFNIIRVWGGGYYPFDDFYETCDELGLLVWQDLMFACASYDIDDELFGIQVRAEVRAQVQRIRNHVSVIVIAGNNECEDGVNGHGLNRMLAYQKMFVDVIKSIVQEETSIFYIHSSPTRGDDLLFDLPNLDFYLDRHYWEVWHGYKPITNYKNITPRLLTEFGIGAFPLKENLTKFLKKEDLYLESPVLISHHKDPSNSLEKITFYQNSLYKKAKSFNDYVDKSLLAQAEGIKIAVEHTRWIQDLCSGAIYWMINDCWPCISWSGIDYYSGLKPLMYYAKKFFAPVLVLIDEKENQLIVKISNTSNQEINHTINYKYMDVSGRVLQEKSFKSQVERAISKTVLKIDSPFNDLRKDTLVYVAITDNHGEVISQNIYQRHPDKDIKYPKANISLTKNNENEIEISSDVFAKNIIVSYPKNNRISDNYFSLLPKEKKVLSFASPIDISKIKIKTIH